MKAKTKIKNKRQKIKTFLPEKKIIKYSGEGRRRNYKDCLSLPSD